MSQDREQLVKRVVHALEESQDPKALVWSYFDEDRAHVIEAARQTLEATREEVSTEKVASVVDKELIEALRFPKEVRRGLPVALFLNRGTIAVGSALVTLGGVLAFLLA